MLAHLLGLKETKTDSPDLNSRLTWKNKFAFCKSSGAFKINTLILTKTVP